MTKAVPVYSPANVRKPTHSGDFRRDDGDDPRREIQVENQERGHLRQFRPIAQRRQPNPTRATAAITLRIVNRFMPIAPYDSDESPRSRFSFSRSSQTFFFAFINRSA